MSLDHFRIPSNALLEWQGKMIHLKESLLLTEVLAQHHQQQAQQPLPHSDDEEPSLDPKQLSAAIYERFHSAPPSIACYDDEDWSRNVVLLAHKHSSYRGVGQTGGVNSEQHDRHTISAIFQRYSEMNDSAINSAVTRLEGELLLEFKELQQTIWNGKLERSINDMRQQQQIPAVLQQLRRQLADASTAMISLQRVQRNRYYNCLKQWIVDGIPPPQHQQPSQSSSLTVENVPAVVDVEMKISNLLEMGFERTQALQALKFTEGDLDQAIVLLLENPGQLQAAGSKNNVVDDKQPPVRPETPSGSGGSPDPAKSTSKNWLLRNIEHQVGSNSNLKRIGSWIEKARSQLTETSAETSSLGNIGGGNYNNNDNSDNSIMLLTPQSESFTVNLGTQVRYTQNLRLIMSRAMDTLLVPTGMEIVARLAQQQTLYSNSLLGLVVLVTPEDLPLYKYGLTGNKEIFSLCRQSPELHFQSIDEQIAHCEDSFLDPDINQVVVKEGDVMITRHSNLPDTHIIFHLIASRQSLRQPDLGQRSPVIAGLKNIMELAGRYNVWNIKIPLLLLPDTLNRDFLLSTAANATATDQLKAPLSLTAQACLSRADLVLKTVKACLMEQRRIYYSTDDDPRSGGAGGGAVNGSSAASAATVQFLLNPSAGQSVWESSKQLVRQIYHTL